MMSPTSRGELLAALRPRYTLGNRTTKQRVLDEVVAATGYHRKYAIELLNHPPRRRVRRRALRAGGVKYTGPVRVALDRVWRAANCICSKRLVPALPALVEALERHGELQLEPQTRQLLLTLSPATADRLLKRARRLVKPHGLTTTKPGTLLKHAIAVRTFAQWNEAQVGFMEIDLVAHGGDSSRGEYLHSLDMVDLQSRWTELLGLVNRSQATVKAAIQTAQARLPFRLLGLDSDNGGEFINYGLLAYCRQQHITFTRCRPYKKNDQAHVEQKNWTAVRQNVGYDRYEGQAACEALNALYEPLRLYINFFQPVMVLLRKERKGAKVKKVYDEAKTPFQRILDQSDVTAEVKAHLRTQYATLNPLALLRLIQARQETLWQLALLPTDATMDS